MRELTAAERKAYDKMILGSRQMNLKELINIEQSPNNTLPSELEKMLKNDSKREFEKNFKGSLLPAAGLEPALPCGKQILSLPRLPIPTRRHSYEMHSYNLFMIP